MSKYIDIHSHVNFKAFDEDRDVVIKRALENDTWVINVGTQYDTSKKAVEMTNDYKEGVYATIGLHPIHTEVSYHDKNEIGSEGEEFVLKGEVFDKEKYKKLARLGRVVAIGECGLDYYRCTEDSIEKQKVAFIAQIELANELGLPLMLHIRNNEKNLSRNAYADTLEILKKYAKVKGVFHFFAGSVEDMKRFIDLGFYISFSGPITFKPNLKICDYYQVISKTPLEMIMADTDSPYVAPIPYRGKKNEPFYIREIVKKIAEIKGLTKEEIARAVFSNAKRLFDI